VHGEAYDTVIGSEFTLVPSANKHLTQTLSSHPVVVPVALTSFLCCCAQS